MHRCRFRVVWIAVRGKLGYYSRMHRKTFLAIWFFVLAGLVSGQDASAPNIADFANVTSGRYQVFVQGGHQMGREINDFMNAILGQYERFFNNWSGKADARVIVFDNVNDFHHYAGDAVPLLHAGLAGYCHLKTDEAGNQFYELVTYQDPNLWRVLAHEGFHQFIGYELGQQIPTWLNEGMAQYFETSYNIGSHFYTGQISRNKLLYAQALIVNKQAPPLAQIIQWDRATFYANANVAYPMSWALVYYLINSKNDRFEQGEFRRYLQDLKYGKNDVKSFQWRFESNSNHWQADFEDYILHLKPQTN